VLEVEQEDASDGTEGVDGIVDMDILGNGGAFCFDCWESNCPLRAVELFALLG
jgi:hypothetical protein